LHIQFSSLSAFRAETVRLVRSGRNSEELAREFEPSGQSIRNWVRQADIDEGYREFLTTAERAGLSRLRRENRILRDGEALGNVAAVLTPVSGQPIARPGAMPSPTDHAHPDQPHEARKLVTVLFSDLEGSTRLGETLDTEPLRALLLEYFEEMAAIIEVWGGSVQKYIGDAVVAVFGIPATHDDDAVRAVRAGLEMQDRLNQINPELRDHYGVELAMRIGINTGEVLASTDTARLLAGDVFNVASRIEGLAEPGTVVVGERTYYAIEGMFELRSLGEFVLKGKLEPQAVWRAVEPRLQETPRFDTEMVGRDAELAMLEALLGQAVAGGLPRLVIVVGEAGIGKSRLVAEFVSRQELRARTLGGRALPYGHGITYWPLREVLWEAAGIALDDTSQGAALKLRGLVEGLSRESVPDPGWLASALATTAGIGLDDNPFAALSPESAGEELQLAWPAFASALAADQPTLLVFEDVHWAEKPLLDMVEQLALRAVGPVLIVVTARPEFMERFPGWGARAIPSQISLGPLITGDFDRLIEQLAPGLDDDLRRRLLGSAGGNPFFAEEIARHAAHQVSDLVVGGRMLVPDNARAVIAARIDQLDPADREVLQSAAVIGEVFWPAPLERLHGRDILASLANLEQRGFITTRPTTSLVKQRELAFRHSLMCDVVYQSTPRRRLATTHAAVAEWTESLAADRREEFIEVVAHHYAAAAQPEIAGLAWHDDRGRREHIRTRAVETLIKAGTAARRRYSIDQAVEYADRALALAETDREHLTGLELKAAAYHAAARVNEAWPVYIQAVAAARAIGDEEDVSRVMAEATLLWARYGGAFATEEWKPQALDMMQRRLAEIGEERESLELAALLTGRSVSGRRGLVERTADQARADADRAVSISRRVDSQRLLSHALDAYEMVLREEGFCELGEVADQMVELAHEMVDRRQGHEMLVTAAIALTEVGRYEDSKRIGEIAHADAQTMGVHQRIHGIRASTGYMVPLGMLAELSAATAGIIDLATEDGRSLCDFGGGAVYGRALALFEQQRDDEARAVVEFFKTASPDPSRLPIVRLQLVERIRPFVGRDEAERLLEGTPEPTTTARRTYSIRVRLPMAVLAEDWAAAEQLIVEARSMAAPSCAPQMLVFADWAEAVRDGDVENARSALERLGEPYTAARLAVDFLGTMPPSQRTGMRASTTAALEAMGARASLIQLAMG
jgi:class 3 adenylate cyclase/tetratricopeptide (TPR) repeat protein